MSKSTPVPAPPPPNKPVSVSLARALAEAADGYPGMETLYLVARYISTGDSWAFHITGPYTAWEHVAESLRERVLVGELGFFGPYDTTAAIMPVGMQADYVRVHLEDGSELKLPGLCVDALFLSAAAVEKFALPYYERIFGPEYANDVMAHFRYNSAQVMAHFPWSEYTDPPKPPSDPGHPGRWRTAEECRVLGGDVPLNGPVFMVPAHGGGPMLVPLGGSRGNSAPPAGERSPGRGAG
jgi:hypothetical protein